MEDNTELLVDILVDYCCECETKVEVIEKLATLMVEVVGEWIDRTDVSRLN